MAIKKSRVTQYKDQMYKTLDKVILTNSWEDLVTKGNFYVSFTKS